MNGNGNAQSGAATGVKRIVILGGGFGGVYTAHHLEKLARSSRRLEITLLSRDNYFLMTPLLFEAGSGVLEPRHAVNPIRPLLKRSQFVEAEIQSVDFDRKVVTAAPTPDERHEIPYDHLVVAVGGITNTSLVPGSEHALTFKTLGDAIFLRNHTIDLFERADVERDPKRKAAMMTFVIIGAGLVGTELVGELTEFAANVTRAYKNLCPNQIRLELIEAGKKIVPEMDPELSDYAAKLLTRRGVNIRVNAKVLSIEPGKVHLAGDGGTPGETIESDTIVVATGVKPSPLVERLAIEKDRKGRIIVDGTMLAKGRRDVWALGDCAAIPDPISPEGRPYPQLAQHALREAKVLAANILRSLDNQPLEPFVYSNKGVLAALGHFRGVGRVYKFRIYGFIAWWVWRTYYLLQMPQWQRRVRIVIDWTVALLFKNDIVKLDLFGQEHPLTPRKLQQPADRRVVREEIH
jgi:NADH dehydrogenase